MVKLSRTTGEKGGKDRGLHPPAKSIITRTHDHTAITTTITATIAAATTIPIITAIPTATMLYYSILQPPYYE